MKVVHLWKSDSPRGGGGGAVAMSRLHLGLRRAGIDSRILCELKSGEVPDVVALPTVSRWEKRLQRLTRGAGLNDVHRISSFKLHRHHEISSADVVTLHGTHHGFFNYLAIPRLSRSKPLVFVLHDMWAMTGHCAFAYECERWRHGCGGCPSLDTPPIVQRDNTTLEWRLKKWVWDHSRLTVVSPSQGLAALARKSMLNQFPVEHIPHGIDTAVFRPLERDLCKEKLGIPANKKVIMFSSVDVHDKRKGGDLLFGALRELPKTMKRECLLLTLGKGGGAIGRTTEMECHDAGFITDDGAKAVLYSAADLFVLPSRAEAFGLVLLESIACGTPVLAFDVFGVTDLVRDGITGYRVPLGDQRRLGERIQELLEDDGQRDTMGGQCARIARSEFNLSGQVDSYQELYRKIVAAPEPSGGWSDQRGEKWIQ